MKPQTIRIEKTFDFEMAHALDDHDGKCKNIHGHSYVLKVSLIGTPIQEEGHPKNGMVMDFGDLKQIVASRIVDKFDHALVLWEKSPFVTKEIQENQQKLITVDFQPTCENLLGLFAEWLEKDIPETVKLHHLELRETATSLAQWHAEDQV
ncbi:MAG: 6-pyruvoyltetrahydropterin/6-carboxytetrahydropterin synthase [Flavobacteriales bacterium]|jgi:6-pyruvoyltetrahydropterin/6-carboxytetrahydropterin synthase